MIGDIFGEISFWAEIAISGHKSHAWLVLSKIKGRVAALMHPELLPSSIVS
jgi:hypothetical protein